MTGSLLESLRDFGRISKLHILYLCKFADFKACYLYYFCICHGTCVHYMSLLLCCMTTYACTSDMQLIMVQLDPFQSLLDIVFICEYSVYVSLLLVKYILYSYWYSFSAYIRMHYFSSQYVQLTLIH